MIGVLWKTRKRKTETIKIQFENIEQIIKEKDLHFGIWALGQKVHTLELHAKKTLHILEFNTQKVKQKKIFTHKRVTKKSLQQVVPSQT